MGGQLGFEFTDFDRDDARDVTRPPSGIEKIARGSSTRPIRHRGVAQLPLTLERRPGSEHEGTIRGQVRVETVLREILGPRVIVQLTSNRSTMISYKRRRGVLYVRAHAIFCDAPFDVLRAMASFVSDVRATAREAKLIDEWIELNRHQIKKPDRSIALFPHGEVHDLQPMLDRLNGEFFQDRIKAGITWSKAARNQRRTSIRMGSYCDETQVIRIHPALDQDFVPAYFVESVVFHEMLHEHHGVVEKDDGRRCVHTREFQRDERLFPEYGEARRWEKKNLGKLLRY